LHQLHSAQAPLLTQVGAMNSCMKIKWNEWVLYVPEGKREENLSAPSVLPRKGFCIIQSCHYDLGQSRFIVEALSYTAMAGT
jgi:hypothetical protein